MSKCWCCESVEECDGAADVPSVAEVEGTVDDKRATDAVACCRVGTAVSLASMGDATVVTAVLKLRTETSLPWEPVAFRRTQTGQQVGVSKNSTKCSTFGSCEYVIASSAA